MPTELHFLTGNSKDELLAGLLRRGVDIGEDYVSLHCLYRSHEFSHEVQGLLQLLPHADRSTVGVEHVVAVNLTKPQIGIPVVKLVAPGMRVPQLATANTRDTQVGTYEADTSHG